MITDKHGVYRVGDMKFYSKLQAIEMQAKSNIHPHWDFNEAVYSCYDWTLEPAGRITDLYRRRAQQLRDRYDYLVLMFSGGADSTNVLQSFLQNNIMLDEVCSYVNYEATGDKEVFLNDEIFKVAVPLIENLKGRYPWLKHRLLDISQLTIDFFTDPVHKFEWIYNQNHLWNPNNACRESLPLKIREWTDLIDQGKKLCLLYAHDKPRIFQHNDGRFSFRFIDSIDGAATVKSMAGMQPYYDELFYWSPDLPEIPIKQAHMILRYLLRPDFATAPYVSAKRSDLAFRKINDKIYWLSNHGVHSIIYPDWDVNTYTIGKVSSAIFSERDTWVFTLNDNEEIKRNWRIGIEKLWTTVPDHWKNDPENLSRSIKMCWSRDYYLN